MEILDLVVECFDIGDIVPIPHIDLWSASKKQPVFNADLRGTTSKPDIG